jgi:hypothetical protein
MIAKRPRPPLLVGKTTAAGTQGITTLLGEVAPVLRKSQPPRILP